jgi:hypothetical protein
MSDATRCARVPAELSRAGWQRTAAHVATAGQVTGDSVAYMVMIDGGTARLSVCTTGMVGPPSEALATAVGLERVTTRRTLPGGRQD